MGYNNRVDGVGVVSSYSVAECVLQFNVRDCNRVSQCLQQLGRLSAVQRRELPFDLEQANLAALLQKGPFQLSTAIKFVPMSPLALGAFV